MYWSQSSEGTRCIGNFRECKTLSVFVTISIHPAEDIKVLSQLFAADVISTAVGYDRVNVPTVRPALHQRYILNIAHPVERTIVFFNYTDSKTYVYVHTYNYVGPFTTLPCKL